MVEYRALAQNTYKFVTEHTFNHVGDISSPIAPMCGKAKVIKNGDLYYEPITPFGTATASSSGAITQKSDKKSLASSSSSNAEGLAKAALYCDNIIASCEVDGKKYFGLKNASYSIHKTYASNTSTNSTIRMEGCRVPHGKVKAVVFSANNKTINIEEYEFETTAVEDVSYTATGSYVPYGSLYVYWSIPKVSDDIILAVEIEYPKYDVTFKNTVNGLQYSLDDGVTFADVTEGLALSQIEHVIFKNTGGADISIGMSEGSGEVGTVSAGSTYVAIPEADGTWYLS